MRTKEPVVALAKQGAHQVNSGLESMKQKIKKWWRAGAERFFRLQDRLPKSWPLSAHLIVLTLAIMLPLLLFTSFAINQSFEAQRETIHQNSQRMADGVAANLDREITSIITILNLLAQDSAFDRQDYAAMYNRGTEVLKGRAGQLLLVGKDNQPIFNTRYPLSASLPELKLPPGIEQILMQKRPAMTDLFEGRSSGRTLFAVIVPVIRDDELKARLHLSLEPSQLSRIMTESILLPDWRFAVSDRTGKIIVGDAQFAVNGKVLPLQIQQQATKRAGNMVVTTGEEPLLVSYRRSSMTGWLSMAAIPLATVETPLQKIWKRFMVAGGGFLVLSLIAAYVFGRAMASPIHSLTRAAALFGQGQQMFAPKSAVREANVLSAVMQNAASQLEERSRALAETERRFRLFANRMPDAIWFLNVQSKRIEYVSPAFEVILGRTSGEISRLEDWMQTIHSDDLPFQASSFSPANPPRDPMEYRIVRPDGSVRWVRDVRFLLQAERGRSHILAGILRDFTDYHDALEALKNTQGEAEARLLELEHLYESTPIGLALIDREFRLERINGFMARMKGGDRKTLLGTNLFDAFPEIREVAEPISQAILRSGEAVKNVELETKTPHENAEQYWIAHFYPVLGEGRQVSGIGIVLENTTEQKLAQNASARLAAIVYAANDAMFSCNLNGVIQNWNPAAEQLFQYGANEAIGMQLSMLWPEGRFDEESTKLLNPDMVDHIRIQTELRRKDGSTVPVLASAGPIKHDGQTTALSLTLVDITERKLWEERQLLMNRELSHRVKNSLAVIQAMARHTLRSSPNPAAFTAAFEGRLGALSISHGLLTSTEWKGAELRDLISDQLAPHIAQSSQLVLEGPHLVVPPSIVTALGLVLHELGTNAVKFGALSTLSGKVKIIWSVEGTGRDRRLLMDWYEIGGPPVTPPERTGFGSTLIQHSGKIKQHFNPEGLHCSIEMHFSADAPKMF